MKNLSKKALAVFIVLIMSVSLAVVSSATEETTAPSDEPIIYNEAKTGDIDDNGIITAADARILLRCAVELEEITEYILLYGDFDKNNTISADDARTVLRIAVKLDSVKCILHGHENYNVKKAATCTTEGYTQKFCHNCQYTDNVHFDIIPASDHSIINNTTAASCTADSVFTSVCSVCGFVAASEVREKAYGHDFGIWQLQGEIKTKTCKRCSYTETAPNVKTIYLTFDDGPGGYTARLLNYLKEYNVKATFFVTNQRSDYRYLLKTIVNDGHAIAVHSYSHAYQSIYSSQANYLSDFNKMHQIILEETGVDTKIFRFPGGTNNTVSRNYSRGIMSAMAEYMTNAGYIYFDWNVDSGDTTYTSASKVAQNTIAQIKNRQISIVLMHDIKYATVEAIRTIIKYGLDNGYKFEILDQSTPRVQFSPVN